MAGLSFQLGAGGGLIMGGGGGSVAAISLSNKTVLSGAAAGTVIGLLSISAPGTWLFTVDAPNDAGDRVTTGGTNGVELRCTSTPFSGGVTSYEIHVRATRAAPYAEIAQAFIITVAGAGVGYRITPAQLAIFFDL